VALQLRAGFLQPQHRVRQFGQQRAPGIERLGADLVRMVEGAQHQRVFRQAGSGAPHRLWQWPVGATGQQGQWQLRQLFAEAARQLQRRDQRVADDVVDGCHATAAGVAQVGGLDRRRSARHHAHAGATRVAGQIHQQVDAIGADALGSLFVRKLQGAQVDEGAGQLLQACAQRRAIVGTGRIQEQLEALAVQRLQHLDQQLRHRVVTEIEGQQPEPDA